jgi:hypothetical protein
MPNRERIDALAHGLGHLVRGLRGAQDALGHGVGLVLRQVRLLGDVDHARGEIHRGLARQNQRGGHGGPAQYIVGSGVLQLAPATDASGIGVEGVERLLPVDLGVHLFDLGGQITLAGGQVFGIARALAIC